MSIAGGEIPIDAGSMKGDFMTADCTKFMADEAAQKLFKNSKKLVCVCVHMLARERVRGVCACVCVRARALMCACVAILHGRHRVLKSLNPKP